MQFLLIAYDAQDKDAKARRMAARPEHIALADKNKKAGHALYAAALLDTEGEMIGSMMMMDYPSRKELEAWLAEEPYMVQDVWDEVSVQECRVGPSFVK